MPKRSVADDLAEALVRAGAAQRNAGRALHDDIGPLLSAAGLRLQLVQMDFPDAAERVREVLEALDEAMERVRTLSAELNPSPVYRAGFKNALTSLVESYRARFPGKIRWSFTSSARLPVETAAAMYEAAAVAMAAAVEHSEATLIDVSVRGSSRVSLRVKDNGRRHRSPRTLALAALLAHHAGLTLETSTGKGTIVCIEHALRRPARR